MKKVLVAMSGGVDSSVSALLLKNKGYEVAGAHMRLRYNLPFEKEKFEKNIEYVKKTADLLGIDFHVVNLENIFEEKIIQPFITDYQNGITPNPCVNCNMKIKFGELYRFARENGFDYMATGHYAHSGKTDTGRYSIYYIKEQKKDQSYYLYGLEQEVLEHIIFPLDGMVKEDVRRIAREHNLPAAEREESQEICFVDDDYRGFFKQRNIEFKTGKILDTSGNILGNHNGMEGFTIGQRKGLNIALGSPKYVVELEKTGDVVIGDKEDLMAVSFIVEDIKFMGLLPEDAKNKEVKANVLIRYNSQPVECFFQIKNENQFIVTMSKPTMAVTPGQAAVFYHPENNYILAGGKIKNVLS